MGTREFTDAVIERLGSEPKHLTPEKPAQLVQTRQFEIPEYITSPRVHKDLVGVDFFVDWDAPDRDPEVRFPFRFRKGGVAPLLS
jgi:isocitrate dehydrogenase